MAQLAYLLPACQPLADHRIGAASHLLENDFPRVAGLEKTCSPPLLEITHEARIDGYARNPAR